MASTSVCSACSLVAKSGHQPPSSATPHSGPRRRMTSPALRYTSAVHSSASPKLRAAGQTTMKSWMSTRRPACAPPPKIWTCGIGSSVALAPPRYSNNGTPQHAAMAWAAAIDTASVALAPSRARPSLPSSAISRWSSAAWSSALVPCNTRAISPFKWPTACCTSSPPKRTPPSRSSSASRLPLDTPAGAMAVPNEPSCSLTSASTVGRPRLSQTRRPWIEAMWLAVMSPTPCARPIQPGSTVPPAAPAGHGPRAGPGRAGHRC